MAKERETEAGDEQREGLDKSVQAFRDALERSVNLTRDRLQEAMDDAVKRGRMTREDANDLVSRLVSRGRQQTEDLLRDLERLLNQVREQVGERTAQAREQAGSAARQARRQVGSATERASQAARDVADEPLKRADQLRRRAGVGSFPITAYDQLTVAQVKDRLDDLSPAELRKVSDYEKANQARAGVISALKKKLKD
jgi:polyhydroxyalkanoate synthesis regulator phasin